MSPWAGSILFTGRILFGVYSEKWGFTRKEYTNFKSLISQCYKREIGLSLLHNLARLFNKQSFTTKKHRDGSLVSLSE